MADFSGFSPLKKLFFAKSCEAPWPCDKECIEDFEMPCPAEWAIQDDGLFVVLLQVLRLISFSGSCASPKTYHGVCVREPDLRTLLPEHKRMWGEICSVRW